MGSVRKNAALGVFALLITAAPLLFGAVDRQVQTGLVLLLGAGLLLVPPLISKPGPREKWLLYVLVALIVLKEFAPSVLFGATKWHNILAQDYNVSFPWTHNPEPGRAVDALLALTVGAVWFLWVRTLAAESDDRTLLLWILVGTATVLALVCLTVRPSNPHLIYGVRLTPGWTGYGPFPNRNHTACFLAMGALLGCGCLTNALRRKKQLKIVASFLCILLVFVALLMSSSRGGLVAFAIGLCVYGGFVLLKERNKKVLLGMATGCVVLGVIFLAFGMKVASRFQGAGDDKVSVEFRQAIWKDTLGMWKDAPLFGHGLETFPQLFPIYETLKLENKIVLHPESSWLLALAEFGLIPLLILVIATALFLSKNVRLAFERKQGFFLTASGFSALVVLIAHSAWDVPAHRWAVAAYGLAILAVSCPARSRDEKAEPGLRVAVVPFAIVAFWLLPYFTSIPGWSPTSLMRLLTRDESLVSASEWEHELMWFPLSPSLHQGLGMRLLEDYKDPQEGWRHFRVADRLAPSSWPLAAAQAVASKKFSAGMALHFWSLAIERAGHRSEEIFFMAYDQTARLPMASTFWNSYVESNPELLLSYCRRVPDANGMHYYQLWWNRRASNPDVKDFEAQNFYSQAAKFGSIANINQWMTMHPEREANDFKAWAALLHHWGDDATAWKIISRWVKEPKYPEAHITENLDALEAKWFANPDDMLDAQLLAQLYTGHGQKEKANEVILAVAAQEKAPRWFLEKGAYIQASQGRYGAAVQSLLR